MFCELFSCLTLTELIPAELIQAEILTGKETICFANVFDAWLSLSPSLLNQDQQGSSQWERLFEHGYSKGRNSLNMATHRRGNSLNVALHRGRNSLNMAPHKGNNSLNMAPHMGKNSLNMPPYRGRNSMNMAPHRGGNSLNVALYMGRNSLFYKCFCCNDIM